MSHPLFVVSDATGETGERVLRSALVQFPDIEDHYDFILNGSENWIGYGINGIGRGWMPGFGTVLRPPDLALIVDFERSLD